VREWTGYRSLGGTNCPKYSVAGAAAAVVMDLAMGMAQRSSKNYSMVRDDREEPWKSRR
jgi:hypothetical protein